MQWRVLTTRALRTMARRGELVIAVIAPVVFGLGFYLPLKFVMQLQGIDYAQFLMPIIVLQSMAFTAISAAQLAASEASPGQMRVCRPCRWSPECRCSPEWRPDGPFGGLADRGDRITATRSGSDSRRVSARRHCSARLAFVFSMCLSSGRRRYRHPLQEPEATSQALTLPQLILGMLSCGFVPETGFPEWIRPFVRNQPISQFSFAMRDMAQGGVTWEVFRPSVFWIDRPRCRLSSGSRLGHDKAGMSE